MQIEAKKVSEEAIRKREKLREDLKKRIADKAAEEKQKNNSKGRFSRLLN